MHASSKLRSLRKLKSRDNTSNGSPTMRAASRRGMPNPQPITRSSRASAPLAGADSTSGASSADAYATSKLEWRHNSSAEIPIPSFMIPCSAGSLMNMRYALTSDVPTGSSSFVTSYPQAISQR